MTGIRQNNKGFTLIEMLMAMAIFSILIGIAVSAKIAQQGQHITQDQAADMQQSARASMYLLARSIRMAGFSPNETDSGAGMIAAGDGSSGSPLTFSMVADDDGVDNNNDGTVDEDDELEIVSFAMDGSSNITVEYNNSGTVEPLAENIESLGFVYLDRNGAVTADLDDIRAVEVSIRASSAQAVTNELDYAQANNNTRTLTAVIKARNLGL